MTLAVSGPIAPTVGAVLLFWASLTPSLLPLGPVFQGVVSAACALLGYAVGALLGWMLRASGVSLRRRPSAADLAGRRRSSAVSAPWSMLVLGHRWDDQVRDLVGVDRDSLGADLLQLVVTAVLFVLLLAISRGLKSAGRWVGRQIGRVLPDRVALVIGALVVAWIAWGLVTGVLGGRVVGALDATFQAIDDEFRTDTPAPTSPYVSAGPESGESWDDLGRQGRVFIASAPTADEIADFTGGDAQQPVRAYVGASGDVDLRRGGAARGRRARAHGWLRPGRAQRRHRHRPRLGQREPGARARVHVGRRHRDRQRCSTPTCPAGCRS